MTNKEIVEAATAYRNEKIKQDKADGHYRKYLCYGDIKQAYIDGAEWYKLHCTPQLELSNFKRENNRHPTIEEFLEWQQSIDIDKACEWLKGELYDESTIDPRHPTDISSRTYWTVDELVNAFRNAMNN